MGEVDGGEQAEIGEGEIAVFVVVVMVAVGGIAGGACAVLAAANSFNLSCFCQYNLFSLLVIFLGRVSPFLVRDFDFFHFVFILWPLPMKHASSSRRRYLAMSEMRVRGG